MKITVSAIGKLKESYLKDAENHFKTLISKKCTFEINEIPDEPIPDNPSPAVETKIKEKEGSALLKKIKPHQYVIALAIDGKTANSGKFRQTITDCVNNNKDDIVYIIGGSLGLSEEVLKRADCRLSFSPMTFPHQLMRIMLMEQLSRSI